jgi:Secretion system C-terminal sorting domain
LYFYGENQPAMRYIYTLIIFTVSFCYANAQSIIGHTTICQGNAIELALSGAAGPAAWYHNDSLVATGHELLVYDATLADSGVYVVVFGSDTLQTFVSVKQRPTLSTSGSQKICSQKSLSLTVDSATPDATYTWSGPNGFVSTVKNVVITTAPLKAAGVYTVTASLNGCEFSAWDTVAIDTTPAKPVIITNDILPKYLCQGDTLEMFSVSPTLLSGISYHWTGLTLDELTGKHYSDSGSYVTIPGITAAQSGLYVVAATLGGCSSTDTTYVIVLPDTLCGVVSKLLGVAPAGGITDALQVYPNPANGAVNINVLEAISEPAVITITDQLGREMRHFTTTTNEPAMIRTDLPPGFYVVKATAGSRKQFISKLVVK